MKKARSLKEMQGALGETNMTLQETRLSVESIIYDHFPSCDEDFKQQVESTYTMDELRKSCEGEIMDVIETKCDEARKDEIAKMLENAVNNAGWVDEEYLNARAEELNIMENGKGLYEKSD